jgi:hypothetical protein
MSPDKFGAIRILLIARRLWLLIVRLLITRRCRNSGFPTKRATLEYNCRCIFLKSAAVYVYFTFVLRYQCCTIKNYLKGTRQISMWSTRLKLPKFASDGCVYTDSQVKKYPFGQNANSCRKNVNSSWLTSLYRGATAQNNPNIYNTLEKRTGKNVDATLVTTENKMSISVRCRLWREYPQHIRMPPEQYQKWFNQVFWMTEYSRITLVLINLLAEDSSPRKRGFIAVSKATWRAGSPPDIKTTCKQELYTIL